MSICEKPDQSAPWTSAVRRVLVRIEANFEILARLSRGFSGGDILNICVNAIHAGSADDDPAKWTVTQGMLEREIQKVKKDEKNIQQCALKEKRTIRFRCV